MDVDVFTSEIEEIVNSADVESITEDYVETQNNNN